MWAWVIPEVVSQLDLTYMHQQGKLSNSAPARPPKPVTGKRHGSSPAFMPFGSSHPYLWLKASYIMLHSQESRHKAHSPSVSACEGVDQLSGVHIIGAGSPVPSSTVLLRHNLLSATASEEERLPLPFLCPQTSSPDYHR